MNLINANYVNHGFGGNMPGHHNQRGIRVRVGPYIAENNFGQVPDDCPPAEHFVLDPQEDCNPNWQPETMPPQPVRPVLIRLEAIWEKTPPNFDQHISGDPADEAFIKLVTAHEIGHMLSMPEWPYGGSGDTSVMIDGASFLQHFGPSFENVPTNYLPRDVEYLMLFCGTNEARVPCTSAF